MAASKITYRALHDSPGEVSAMMLALARLAHRLSAKAVIRGSHEAALAEAQGGRLASTGAENHLTSIVEAGKSIHNSVVAFHHGADYVAKVSHSVYLRLMECSSPLLAAGNKAQSLVSRTQSIASNLQRHHATRLSEVHFVAGERTYANLVSRQLSAWGRRDGSAMPLVPDGAYSCDLVRYLHEIAELAVEPKSAKVLIAPQLQQLRRFDLQQSPIVRAASQQELSMISRPMQFVIDYGRGLVDIKHDDVKPCIDALVRAL